MKNGKNYNIPKNGKVIQPKIGILEWFHLNDYEHAKKSVDKIKTLGVKELRTGVSWADYQTDEGKDWYHWLIPFLAQHFEILPCLVFTPPLLGITAKPSSPPKNPSDYADFVNVFVNQLGQYFDYVELWDEPNNLQQYDYVLDETWDIFSKMIIGAANCAKSLGKKTVLGGISPINPTWIKIMCEKKVIGLIDVVGIHGFPDVFDSYWRSWEESIKSIQNILNIYHSNAEIWITETGFSTWRFDERRQIEKFINVLNTSVNRVYWHSLFDMPSHGSTPDGLHIDEREHHFGLIHGDGTPKLLYKLWASGGIKNVVKNKWMTSFLLNGSKNHKEPVLITGGAGFIGTNLAHRLLSLGYPVFIYDNLSRLGAEHNLKWLKAQHRNNLTIVIDDVRNDEAVENAVQHVSHIFHFAAQVAVTTSLVNPVYDYSVNVKGTLNLLEAIRKSSHKPSLIFTSTNKVYGNLDDLSIHKDTTRYIPDNEKISKSGINEFRRLDFHSPYGSSKGAADQYVLDYARSYDLNNVVFRMSCIYGEHQFGTEDQGWVAYFALKALNNEAITIFGDGLQVRDVLFVNDLIEAFLLAWKHIDTIKGEAFNIGGGPDNSVSLMETIQLLESITGKKISIKPDNWRKGDQKYYVSDTTKFREATGWIPVISVRQGVKKLFDWLQKNYSLSLSQVQMF